MEYVLADIDILNSLTENFNCKFFGIPEEIESYLSGLGYKRVSGYDATPAERKNEGLEYGILDTYYYIYDDENDVEVDELTLCEQYDCDGEYKRFEENKVFVIKRWWERQ